MGLLEGRVAFITGGASEIGKGTALRFAQEGAKIGLADMLREEGLGRSPQKENLNYGGSAGSGLSASARL